MLRTKGLILLVLISGWLISAAPSPLILQHAQMHLSPVGELAKTSEGFVYVKASEAYIEEALTFLGEEVNAPPAYYGIRKVGAHITAITEKEAKGRKLFLPQLGQPVLFRLTHFSSIESENTRYYYFAVDIPQVELIRLANGLPAKIPGQQFHMTVGVESLAEISE